MATNTPQAIVILRVPAYDGDPRLDDYEHLADMQTGTVYGDCRNLAVALMMLHYMTLDDSRGATPGSGSSTGSVKSEKEGDLAKSYGATSSSVSDKYPDLSQTIYGLELIELRNRKIFNPRNRMLGVDNMSHVLPTAL